MTTPDAREAAPFSAGRWTHEPTGECFDASVLNGLVQHYIAAALTAFAATGSARGPRDADATADVVARSREWRTHRATHIEKCGDCRSLRAAVATGGDDPALAAPCFIVEARDDAATLADALASRASSAAPSTSAARQTDATTPGEEDRRGEVMATKAESWAKVAANRPRFDAHGLHAKLNDDGSVHLNGFNNGGNKPDVDGWRGLACWILVVLGDDDSGGATHG